MAKKATSKYKVTIKVLGRNYTAEGNTLDAALLKLKVPIGGKGMSVVTVQKGKEGKDRVLTSIQTARLFSPSKIIRQVALKHVSELFNI